MNGANIGRVINLDSGGGGVQSFNGRRGAVAPQKGDYTAEDVGASPEGHKHTRSEITDFPTSMPASDVAAWAKAASKPTYTAAEVGARPSTWMPTAADVGAKASTWKPYHVGTSAPTDTTQLWIDTTANTGGLKYHNGSAWVVVPVAYT